MDKRPEEIVDPKTKEVYFLGNLLGIGTFANCYELTDKKKNLFALKRISKPKMENSRLRIQMQMEIAIHKTLDHENIVKFHRNFEDKNFYYIVLEICMQKTLMELKMCRGKITEPETRYFCKQLVLACDYLRGRMIIHRDLKLENVFLNTQMVVKVGDFGLATKMKSEKERRKTLCGTPNYIAPEVLEKKGYSCEADSWSLGVIIFVLLTGEYPFLSSTITETYSRIKKAQFTIPDDVSQSAQEVIRSLLQRENRPSMKSLLEMTFFNEYTPNALPISVLSSAPRFDTIYSQSMSLRTKSNWSSVCRTSELMDGYKDDSDKRNGYTNNLLVQLKEMMMNIIVVEEFTSETLKKNWLENVEDLASAPVFWITKWLDFSQQLGFGYQLNDTSTGVEFSDKSRMIVTTNDNNVQYIDSSCCEALYTRSNLPEHLLPKIKLHSYFQRYMAENLITTGNYCNTSEKESLIRLPFLLSWHRTDEAIILQLSSGMTQINFIADHVKVILCPHMSSFTIVDEKKVFKTFTLSKLRYHGITKWLHDRIEKCLRIMENFIKS